ncbi:M48 family metallopeptidase [Campylobacter mucosalis]|uniref:Peptidase, M48 family n=1 Tax=Campylobacter mucosalis CCUG 21559 TaxID=1032067 RepID=A0A6G5QIN9_9BACT|nr:M48 family metallopeptidase [Campylobacter mucosalis]QCD45447.1 peptidase, M48 family [Campylobacter mucosalis CCUG 21559]
MIYFLVFIYFLYVFLRCFFAILQINFIKNASLKKAVVLSDDEYKNAANIAIQNQKFELTSLIFNALVAIFWIVFGLKILYAYVVTDDTIAQNIAFAMAFVFINLVIDLPFNIYEKFIKDKKQGFSNLTPKIFIVDTIKSLLLTLVFGSGFIWIILTCIDFLGEFWWLWAFFISFGIIIVINLIYPTIIAPMFNKVTPLEEGELKSAIENLLIGLGFKSSGVFVMDASKRDSRLNAYFGGLGATKRVVLFDTLIQKLSIDEIIAVLGHELGHFKHKDILKMIALSAIMLFLFFAIFANIPNSVYESIGVFGGGGFVVFFLLFSPIFSFLFNPIIGFISRKNEFGADEFGARTKDKQSMIDALKKLGLENKAFPLSHPLYSAIYHSHPTLFERIEKLKNES